MAAAPTGNISGEATIPPGNNWHEATRQRLRFVAKGLRSQRERLGLSAAQFSKLVGVSEQSIYNWERGVTRPRSEQLGVLATLRTVRKREAKVRLEQLANQASKRRRKS